MAIACFRLRTRLPDRPLFNVPRLRSRIARATFRDAVLPYLAILTSWFPGGCRTRPAGVHTIRSSCSPAAGASVCATQVPPVTADRGAWRVVDRGRCERSRPGRAGRYTGWRRSCSADGERAAAARDKLLPEHVTDRELEVRTVDHPDLQLGEQSLTMLRTNKDIEATADVVVITPAGAVVVE